MKRLKAGLLFGVAAVMLFNTTPARAFNVSMYGIDYDQGYLTGGTGDTSAPDSDCGFLKANGLPATYLKVFCEGVHVTTKQAFVDYVYDRLDGNTQQRVGASFIIYTMLGYNGNNKGLSRPFPLLPQNNNNAIVKAWKEVMSDNAVTVENSASYPYTVNSAYTRFGGRNDVVFYQSSGSAESLVFKYNGNVVYVVKKECANPVGGNGFPDIIPWHMSGRTTVSDTTVVPGQTVTFTHYVKNAGTTTSSSITAGTNVTGGAGNAKSGIAAGTLSSVTEKNVATDTITIPSGATAGQQFCQRVTFTPISSTNSGTGTGDYACATVARDWVINGAVTASDGPLPGGASIGTAYPGTTVYFNYDLSNAGVDASDSINWNADGQTGSRVLNGAGTARVRTNQAVPISNSTPNGTVICKTLTWRPKSSTDSGTGSAQACVTVIVVRPSQAYFFGGDVWAVGDIVSAVPAGSTGSRAQYGVFSNAGDVSANFVSANRYDSANRTALVFANMALPLGHLGRAYEPSKVVNLIGATVPSPGVLDLATLEPNATRYYSGDVTINGGTVGVQARVFVHGKVTVAGNITYDGSGKSSLNDVPNLTISTTRGITINNAVTHVDASLLTDGTLQTCEAKPLVQATCGNTLIITGATRAASYLLYRTNQVVDPVSAAEVFVYPPAAVIAPYAGSITSQDIKTDTELELPPRY